MEQRVIKFRAWEKFAERMLQWEDIKQWHFYWLESDVYVMLQSTGLKDKEGVEIFEGDIVESEMSTGVIEYGHGKFGINWDYGTQNESMIGAWGQVDNLRTMDDGYDQEIKVIGSIYTHPHLIETK